MCTFFVNGVHTLSHFVFAVGIALHVGEDPRLIGPEIVVGAEKVDRKLADVMLHALDVGGNVLGVADLGRPPPERGSGCKVRPSYESGRAVK